MARRIAGAAAVRLLWVCEGPGDVDDLVVLTHRALRATHPWLADHDEGVPPWPTWWTFHGRNFRPWRDIDRLCDAHGVPRVQGLGLSLGRRAATRLFRWLSLAPEALRDQPLRVLLVHDDDGRAGWRASLQAARDEGLAGCARTRPSLAVDAAVGVASPEHEAWVIAAFEPREASARSALETQQRALGFDPRTEADRLTSGREDAPRDAKRVLRALCPDMHQRRALLAEVDLTLLRARGRTTGLADFLEALRTRVATAWGYVAPTAPP